MLAKVATHHSYFYKESFYSAVHILMNSIDEQILFQFLMCHFASRCKKKAVALKRGNIHVPPKILTLQLKR